MHVLVVVVVRAHSAQWAQSWCTMSVWLWMDMFLLFHAFSLANDLASAFTHGTTLGSRDMMAPSYPVLSFPPNIVPGMTPGGGRLSTMLLHRNHVVLSQLMDAGDASVSH